jgi:uncharacterized membrane protein
MIHYIAIALDFIGSLTIFISCVKVIFVFLMYQSTSKTQLTSGILDGLSFKTGAGVLKTMGIGTMAQMLWVIAVIALRFFLKKSIGY